MKIIITGANGFVGKHLIRSALADSRVTSIIAVSRTPVELPEDLKSRSDASKLTTAIVKDYDEYPADVTAHFKDAVACIWTVAVTPTASRTMDFETVRRVCYDCTVAGIEAVMNADVATPFRFIYMSGIGVERDPSKTPMFMPEYSKMRGATEVKVLSMAESYNATKPNTMEVAFIKTAMISGGGRTMTAQQKELQDRVTGGLPPIHVEPLAKAMVDQAVGGITTQELDIKALLKLFGEEGVKQH